MMRLLIDFRFLKKRYNILTLDLSIEPNNMIEFVWLNQVKEIPAMTNMITLIHVEDNKVILEQDWAVKIKLTNENIE